MSLLNIKSGAKQRISSILWPKYLRTVELANTNAMLKEWVIHLSKIDSLQDRNSYFSHISNTILKDSAFDYMEFGVYSGESLKKWTCLNDNPESRFFGFDTFTGLPDNWNHEFKKGAFTANGNIPIINDTRVKFIKGLFQGTLVQFLNNFKRKSRTLVIHMDADLYTSTLYVLTSINNILREGDIIMFDEFAYPLGEFKAYIDYTSSYGINLEPIAMVDTSMYPDQIAFIVK